MCLTADRPLPVTRGVPAGGQVDGESTLMQARWFVHDAFAIGLVNGNHGIGPGFSTLVLVRTDTASLRSV